MVGYMKNLILLFVLLSSFSSYGLDRTKCSKLLNDGLWKTYKYGGIDYPLTKATKDVGSSKGTFVTSTEASTALSDPKYYSNVSTSETQSTSSLGDCSLIGFENIKRMREFYFEQNSTELLAQMAKGDGEFLNVLTAYSLCEDQAFIRYKSILKNNFSNILISKSPTGQIDTLVGSDLELSKYCHVFN